MNWDVFEWLDLKVEDYVKELKEFDKDSSNECGIINMEIVKEKVEASIEMWKNLTLKESLLRQKSKLTWLKEWDFSTRFFHHVMKEI